jgi:hypothetical protein
MEPGTVILAIQAAEIKRITVQSQPRQKGWLKMKPLSSKLSTTNK